MRRILALLTLALAGSAVAQTLAFGQPEVPSTLDSADAAWRDSPSGRWGPATRP